MENPKRGCDLGTFMGKERNGGCVTCLWQKRMHPRATQMTDMPSLNHFLCCVKMKAHCVIGASFACHRERNYPQSQIWPPPLRSAQRLFLRGRHGGVEKRGGGKPHEGHPSQNGFWTPPSTLTGAFSNPLTCLCSAFSCTQIPRLGTLDAPLELGNFSGGWVVRYVGFSLFFVVLGFSLLVCAFFSIFSKDFKGSAEQETLAFCG